MYCHRNTYNRDASIVRGIVTPLTNATTTKGQAESTRNHMLQTTITFGTKQTLVHSAKIHVDNMKQLGLSIRVENLYCLHVFLDSEMTYM